MKLPRLPDIRTRPVGASCSNRSTISPSSPRISLLRLLTFSPSLSIYSQAIPSRSLSRRQCLKLPCSRVAAACVAIRFKLHALAYRPSLTGERAQLASGRALWNFVAGQTQPLRHADQRHADQRGRVVAGKRLQQRDAQAFRAHRPGAVERLIAVDVAFDLRLLQRAIGQPGRNDIHLLDARAHQRDSGKIVNVVARHPLNLGHCALSGTRLPQDFVAQHRDLVGADNERFGMFGRNVLGLAQRQPPHQSFWRFVRLGCLVDAACGGRKRQAEAIEHLSPVGRTGGQDQRRWCMCGNRHAKVTPLLLSKGFEWYTARLCRVIFPIGSTSSAQPRPGAGLPVRRESNGCLAWSTCSTSRRRTTISASKSRPSWTGRLALLISCAWMCRGTGLCR